MMQGIIARVVCIFLICVTSISYASVDFDLKEANRYLREVEVHINKQDYGVHSLELYQKRIQQLKDKAAQCITSETERLNEIDILLQEMKLIAANNPTNKELQKDIEYIKDKKKIVAQNIFDCRLLLLRVNDVSDAIQNIKLENANNPLAVMPLWETMQGLMLTIGAVLIFIAIVYIGNIIFEKIKLRVLSNIKLQGHSEFVLFKFSLYALIAAWTIFILLEWWGIPQDSIERAKQIFYEGGSIYGIDIIPMRLILGVFAFSIIEMAWKYALSYINTKRKIKSEHDPQIVLISLLSYVVFAIAILVGLGVSGVDFTGLAIVAGALSVGIGFGLQNIVNNFVSGIILLLEKPIKPGDRVSVKDYEGFVKKINLRFTRLTTLAREDVLIPNSDLISSPIINYQFEDKLSKVKCFIGISYASDIPLAKETLLEVAAGHTEVLNEFPNQPMIYLTQLEDNNMIFELHCIIGNINRRFAVRSDLYCQVIERFREKNIEISYPRRDVHILQEG